MLIAQSTRRKKERSYNKDSHLREWIGKAPLLLGWTLIRIQPIEEILEELKKTRMKKELKNSPAQLKKVKKRLERAVKNRPRYGTPRYYQLDKLKQEEQINDLLRF